MKLLRKFGLRFCGFILAAAMGLGGAWAADGSAYGGELTLDQYKNFMGFYQRYIMPSTGYLVDVSDLLKRIREGSKRLRDMQAKIGPKGCEADCAAMAEIDRSLMEANSALREAYGIILADTSWLTRQLGVATDATGNLTDAQLGYDRRKFLFDISMIVSKTVQLDFGPLAAQLSKDLGIGTRASGAIGTLGTGTSDAGRFFAGTKSGKALQQGKVKKITVGDLKHSGAYAIIKGLAGELLEGNTPSEQFASSLFQNLIFGTVEKLNELATEGEPFTPGMMGIIVMMAVANAAADYRGKELEQDVVENRKVLQQAEDLRLIWAAEFKPVMTLRRKLYHKESTSPATGVLVDANWEAGRFRVAAAGLCPPGKKPPRLNNAFGKIGAKNFRDFGPALARAEKVLRRASDRLSLLLEKQKKCLPKTELAGLVKDEKGAAIAGADVFVMIGSKRYTGKSEKDGRYRIKLPGGISIPEMMTVSATMDGYKPGSVKVSKTFIHQGDIVLARLEKKAKAAQWNLEGDWESLDPDNRWRMRVHYDAKIGAFVGVLTKHGNISRDVGFSLGERVFIARPVKDGYVIRQKWRRGKGGKSDRLWWRSTRLDINRSAADRLQTTNGSAYVRVGPPNGNKEVELSGEWISDDYRCERKGITERVKIEKVGETWIGRKVTGDPCVPAGNVSFTFAAPVFTGKEYQMVWIGGLPDSPASGKNQGKVRIDSEEKIWMKMGDDRMIFHRHARVRSPNATEHHADKAKAAPAISQSHERAGKERRFDEAQQAQEEYVHTREQWKKLSDFIDEKRARGENVADLMVELRKLAEKVQQSRARAVYARRKVGLDTGSITVGGKRWNETQAPAKP